MTAQPKSAPRGAKSQAQKVQSIDRAGDRVYAKRVPSCLTYQQRIAVVQSVRAGRSVHQVAAEFSCAEVVVIELWIRAELAETRRIREAA